MAGRGVRPPADIPGSMLAGGIWSEVLTETAMAWYCQRSTCIYHWHGPSPYPAHLPRRRRSGVQVVEQVRQKRRRSRLTQAQCPSAPLIFPDWKSGAKRHGGIEDRRRTGSPKQDARDGGDLGPEISTAPVASTQGDDQVSRRDRCRQVSRLRSGFYQVASCRRAGANRKEQADTGGDREACQGEGSVDGVILDAESIWGRAWWQGKPTAQRDLTSCGPHTSTVVKRLVIYAGPTIRAPVTSG